MDKNYAAKAGFVMEFEPFNHTDPVTHEHKTFIRKSHNHQTSQRLKKFQRCVADALEGHTYRGNNPVEDSRAVRAGFKAAAKSCSGR